MDVGRGMQREGPPRYRPELHLKAGQAVQFRLQPEACHAIGLHCVLMAGLPEQCSGNTHLICLACQAEIESAKYSQVL